MMTDGKNKEREISDEKLKRRDFSRNSRVWMDDSRGFSMLGRDYAANLYNFAWAQAVQNKPLITFVADESKITDDKEEGEIEEGELVDEDAENTENEAHNSILGGEFVDGITENVGNGAQNSILEEEFVGKITRNSGNEAQKSILEGEFVDEITGNLGNKAQKLILEGELVDEITGNLENKAQNSILEGEFGYEISESVRNELQNSILEGELVDEIRENIGNEAQNSLLEMELDEEIDFDSLVVATLEELEAINEEYAEKFFEEACSRLCKTLDDLKKMVSGSELPVLGALVQQALMGVGIVYSVFMKQNNKGHETLLSLLSKMKTLQECGLFSPDQIEEVNEMMKEIKKQTRPSFLGSSENSKATNNNTATPTLPKIKVDNHRLLDLHGNYDEDSAVTKLSVPRQIPQNKQQLSNKDVTTLSTYQQKYVSSFLPSDELPSPTPSEEQNNSDDKELPEVSSSISSKLLPVTSLTNGVSFENKSIMHGKPLLKSRDPRLKHSLMNGNYVSLENQRKHPLIDEASNHLIKRQKQELPGRNDLLISTKNEKLEANRSGGQSLSLNDAVIRKDQVPVASASPLVSLISLLKGIAGDPAMLSQLVKEQQKLAVQSHQKTPALLPMPRTSSAFEKSSEAVPSTSGAQPSFDQNSKTKGQQDLIGKIRMKPRDPRRILHSNMLRKIEHDQMKMGNPPPSVGLIRAQEEKAQVSLSVPKPILVQLNRGIQNPSVIGNYSSASQSASQPSIARSAADISIDQQSASTSRPSDPWGDMDHLLEGYDEAQKAAIQQERARRIEEQDRMIADRKLCLVLDLDHTLLNSAKFSEVDPAHDEMLRRKEEQDREKPKRSLFRFPHMGMWTKLRPGIWNFLEKTSKLFELHLYTMGNKLYATEMAKVLDPTGALFAGRVISRGLDGDGVNGDDRAPKNKDLDGVLGMESAVVIIDDSVRVWPHHKLNLIVVERYTYFPCSRRQFGMPGPSLLEIDHDERLENGTLASSLAVIERIHRTFFASKCPREMDVRNIIATEQRRILSGCRIVFSRVFPVGEANPHMHPLWQTAEQFGATCTNQIDDQVTHVVAYSLGTDKVNWALSTGRFVVHPGWVEASALLYRRASETDFSIKPPQQPQPP